MTTDLIEIGDNVSMELVQQKVAMPKNYSVNNALAAAYLIIRETVDRNNRPALEVCTPDSIKRALLNMIVQGLNPLKKQCYFVVHGSILTIMRSYMGSQASAKYVNPAVRDIRAEVIYKDDVFEYEIKDGRKTIKTHQQQFSSVAKGDIIGAYAVALDIKNNVISTVIMTLDEIKMSWQQSARKGIILTDGRINPEKTHGKFTSEMCLRTVINKLCKPIINTSDDGTLLRATEVSDEENDIMDIVKEEIAENADQKVIDIPAPKNESQFEVSETATIDQAKEITRLSGRLNQKADMLETISSFFERDIKKLSELTKDEATTYIEVLKDQTKELKPDWAS